MKRAVAVAFVWLLAAPAAWAGLRARYGGELRVMLPTLPESFDPALAVTPAELAVARLSFDTLVVAAAGCDDAPAPALAAVFEPDATGRVFRLRLRPGARLQGGAALTPEDVVASLRRLADPGLRSPYAVLGAVLPPGNAIAAGPEGEVQVALAFAYPDWPRALAHPAAAIASVATGQPVGTGPFARAGNAGELRFTAFADTALGRAFLDAVRVTAEEPRAAARALARGDADVAAATASSRAVTGPALVATYLALNPGRLGSRLARVRQAVETSVDPADLTRTFVRPPAEPMTALLPRALGLPSVARPRPAKAAVPAGAPLVLAVDASAPDHAAVAGRIEVRLHDQGVAVRVDARPRAQFREALAAGDYDLALVTVPLVPEPGMALAQLVDFARGREAARDELRAIGAAPALAARRAMALGRAQRLAAELPLLPLYAQGLRLESAPSVGPVPFDAAGAPLLGELWKDLPAARR